MINLHKKLFLRNCVKGKERKLDGATKKGRWTVCASMHFVYMPPFVPTNFKEQGRRSQGFHNHVCDPRDG
jgi:hypothetical protein